MLVQRPCADDCLEQKDHIRLRESLLVSQGETERLAHGDPSRQEFTPIRSQFANDGQASPNVLAAFMIMGSGGQKGVGVIAAAVPHSCMEAFGRGSQPSDVETD